MFQKTADNDVVQNTETGSFYPVSHPVYVSWIAEGNEPLPYEKPSTIADQIAALEVSVTLRNLRGAALGDQIAIGKIQEIEDQIAALRAEL